MTQGDRQAQVTERKETPPLGWKWPLRQLHAGTSPNCAQTIQLYQAKALPVRCCSQRNLDGELVGKGSWTTLPWRGESREPGTLRSPQPLFAECRPGTHPGTSAALPNWAERLAGNKKLLTRNKVSSSSVVGKVPWRERIAAQPRKSAGADEQQRGVWHCCTEGPPTPPDSTAMLVHALTQG